MERPTLAFKTFGCKANVSDTDSLYLEATRRGYQVVDENERADAYIINSCTVTAGADRDARLQANRFKRQNPLGVVAVIGCYAQVSKDQLLAMPEVDLVVGTAEKFRALDLIEESLERGTWERDAVQPASGFLPEIFPGSRNARASIKIQDGCNFSCSFCIIPKARGRSRSLAPTLIETQILEANRQGYQEIILTGIHLAHYGWDIGSDLLSLLRTILKRPTGPRIRLSTLDPFEIPDELIALMRQNERLCPHFHIALQSGSDEVLTGMRRIYQAREFIDVTQKIYAAQSHAFIGVDLIVGFPGETDLHFEQTVKCLEASPWTQLHVFPFSVRQGTRAAHLSGHVAPETIRSRSEGLRIWSDEKHRAFLRSQIGRDLQVVLERPLRKEKGMWQGHSENYVPVTVHTPHSKTKDLIFVTATAMRRNRILGKLNAEILRSSSLPS